MSEPVITLSASGGLRIIHIARPDLAAPAFRLRETTSYRFMGRSGWTRVSMFLPCQISPAEDGWWIIPDASVLALLEDGMELCLEEPAQGFREVFRWSFPAEEPEEQEEPPAPPAEAVSDIPVIEEEPASSAAALPEPEQEPKTPEAPPPELASEPDEDGKHSSATGLAPARPARGLWRYGVAALGGAAMAGAVAFALAYGFPERVTTFLTDATPSPAAPVTAAPVSNETEKLKAELASHRKHLDALQVQLATCNGAAKPSQEAAHCEQLAANYEKRLETLRVISREKREIIIKLRRQMSELNSGNDASGRAAEREIDNLKDQVSRLEEKLAAASSSSAEKAIWGGAVLARSGVIYTLQNHVSVESLRKNLVPLCKGHGGAGCEIISVYENKCLTVSRVANEAPSPFNWAIAQEDSWEASREVSLRACVSVTGRNCTVRFTTCSPASLDPSL